MTLIIGALSSVSDPPPFRKLTIIAKDPGLRLGGPEGPMAFAQVPVPAELLALGPTGYRIKVVNYNATDDVAYKDCQTYQTPTGDLLDPFAPREGEAITDPGYEKRLLGDPNFHAQNAYAIAMRTLGAFERALGRRVSWSSGGHQLHIAPLAFAQANAFYSEPDRALMFGYFFNANGAPVFTSLSHDIVAHETTHALLDGIRSHFSEPSGPDQAAFHEGFADIVALLSIFGLPQVVAAAIGEDGALADGDVTIKLVKADKLTADKMRASIFFGMAKEVGQALEAGERQALRRSVEIDPEEARKLSASGDEHDRGEVIVAAMMSTFLELWSGRIRNLGRFPNDTYNLDSVVEEGAKVATHLLNMAIRGLDYCPPTDIDFGQYLAGLLTADQELVPDDEHGYRPTLRRVFAEYEIEPPKETCDADGCWARFPPETVLTYARSNYSAMTRSPDEFFRFLWENRDAFGISERAYTEVVSISPSSRIGPDGIAIHETICQYVQRFDMFGAEFRALLDTDRPEGMLTTDRYTAFGGGVVILDQYGRVKYHIANPIDDARRQAQRAAYLFDTGQIGAVATQRLRFAATHQYRMGG